VVWTCLEKTCRLSSKKSKIRGRIVISLEAEENLEKLYEKLFKKI